MKVHESNVRFKGFDGTQRGVIREIDLAEQIGPVEFTVEFQVLDISASYNLYLEDHGFIVLAQSFYPAPNFEICLGLS